MGLSRREGLGALLGTLVGGRQAADAAVKEAGSAMQQLTTQFPIHQVGGIGTAEKPRMETAQEIAEKEAYHVRTMRARIKKLKRMMNGDFSTNEDDESYYGNDWTDDDKERVDGLRLNIKALKSVSEAGKDFITARRLNEKNRAWAIENAKEEYEKMIKTWAKHKLWGKLSDLFE